MTLLNESIKLPTKNKIDFQLIWGSMFFGIGWGIVRICPAPSFTLIGLGYYQALYFIIPMFTGIWIHQQWVKCKS